MLHAGPLKDGEFIRAAIVSQTFPVALAAAEVRGASNGLSHAIAYDGFEGSGERLLVVTADFGHGTVVLDKLPLMLSPNHALAEVWARVRPNGAVSVSWQLVQRDPGISVTSANDVVTVANKSDRGLSSVRRTAVVPGSLLRACPSTLDMGSGASGPIAAESLCSVGAGSENARLVLGRSDGAQVLVSVAATAKASRSSLVAGFSVAELSTKVSADGALTLTAPDASQVCVCEGERFGREQVKLVRAERDCVLVQYPDGSQRCLEAQAE